MSTEQQRKANSRGRFIDDAAIRILAALVSDMGWGGPARRAVVAYEMAEALYNERTERQQAHKQFKEEA